MGDGMNAADAVLGPALEGGAKDRTALVWRDRRLSYADCLAGVNRAGNLLRERGVAAGDRVLLLLKDRPETVFALLGAMKIGAVAIPFNIRASAADIAYVLGDSGARMLIVDADFLPRFEEARSGIEGPPQVLVAGRGPEADPDGLEAALAAAPAELESTPMSPGDMAFWLYTSGTTGTPKGAIHRHGDVLYSDAYMAETLGVGPGDVLFATSKLFFAYALGTCLFGGFRRSATTVLCDEWPGPEQVAEIVERNRPTVVFSVPALYRNLLDSGVAGRPGFAAVRHYVSAGERLPEPLWHRWREATGVEILDGMGTSETIYMILTNRPGDRRPGASGRPAPHAEVRLADADGNEVPPGTPGILWVRMGSVAAGYWRREDVSAEVFRDGWFRTGDMYVIDEDGYWIHQGRHDDMLKISGQWVSPAEIEDAVVAHTPVREAVAVGVPDSDDLTRVALFAVGPEEAFEPERLAETVRRAALDHLSPYKCPKWIRFVDRIPRTATGKAQRFKLRRQFLEQRP